MPDIAKPKEDKGIKIVENQLFTIPFQLKGGKLIFELPKDAAKFLDLDLDAANGEMKTFAVPTSGVIQLIGSQPKVTIPATSLAGFQNQP